MHGKEQYIKVVNHLEAMIANGTLAAGSKVPSLRKLGKEFDLSVGTIRRSFDFLQEKGILESRQGAGVFVTKRKDSAKQAVNNKKTRIAVLVSGDDLSKSYCAHALTAVQAAAGNEATLLLNFHDYCALGKIPNNLLKEYASECEAMIFLGCYDFVIDDLPVTKPCVGLEMQSSFNGVMSTVALDPLNAAEIACDFFKEKGHKKVKVLYSEMPVYKFRMQLFADMWSDYGKVECSQSIELQEIEDPNIAYYITSDTNFNVLAKEYREKYGKKLVDERCILSVDGKSQLLPDFEPINSITVDWKTMGEIVYEECMRRVNNPGTRSRRIYQNCFLKLHN